MSNRNYRTVMDLVVVSLLLLLNATEYETLAAEVVGRVTRVQGKAFIISSNGTNPLNQEMPLFVGQTISTGPDARVHAVFNDGSEVTLGQRTRFTIDSYAYGTAGNKALFSMAGTAFRAITGLITKNRGEFKVSTPLATLGIRGTDFWAGHFTPGVLDVFMLAGQAVIVTTPEGEATLNAPGEGVTIPAKGQPPGAVKFWPNAKVERAMATVSFR